jgi:hypothetical protein
MQTNLFPCAEKRIFYLTRSVVNQLLRTSHKCWYSICTTLIVTLETRYSTTNIKTPQINLHFHTTLKTISFVFITETVYIVRYELHVYIQLIWISGGTNFILRIKEQETCTILQEHDDDNMNFVFLNPFQGPDCLSPPSRRGGRIRRQGQFAWDLWWA